MKKLALFAVTVAALLAGCSEADMASRNLSKEADRFNVERRIVFYNSFSDSFMLTIEGKCSLGNQDKARELTVTCKTGPTSYKKHFLGLSDNVTYMVEQTSEAAVSGYNSKIIFRPQTLIPSIELDVK